MNCIAAGMTPAARAELWLGRGDGIDAEADRDRHRRERHDQHADHAAGKQREETFAEVEIIADIFADDVAPGGGRRGRQRNAELPLSPVAFAGQKRPGALVGFVEYLTGLHLTSSR
jgi:hypothetical protein